MHLDDTAQYAFALLSGDHNPLHLDPVAARRELLGTCVVHGLHGVFFALEPLLAEHPSTGLATLRARFREPIAVGADIEVESRGDDTFDATVSGNGSVATKIKGRLGPPVARDRPPGPPPPERQPGRWTGDRSGELVVGVDPRALRERFPALTAGLGAAGAADLLALTRLVGMECPGRQSIFGSFDLRFRDDPDVVGLRWSVREHDPRFSRVEIVVQTRSFEGTVEAFVRPPPVAQPPFEALRSQVAPDAFAGWRTLVVGGTRGLGEVMAKLVAAGGSPVWVTWHHGADDAARVVDEIRRGGGAAEALHLDATAPLGPLPDVTHTGYFAAPRILARRGGFRFDDHARFVDVFVHGFARVMAAVPTSTWALYPSTTFVDAPGRAFAEYAAAKRAGEALCAALGQTGRAVHVARFGRLRTDQTQALGDTDAPGDPVPALLEVLRGAAQKP